jgi:uncharacterized RDD family membrane protein YckC
VTTTLTDTFLRLETPEGVELGLRIAGPIPRALAWLVDLGIRLGIYFALASVFSVLGEAAVPILLLSLFALEWSWSIGFEVYGSGATPGKRVLGLRVVKDDGTPVGWQESVLRNVTRTADFLPFGYAIGLASIFATDDGKRLGDRVAGTLVVHREPPPGSDVSLPDVPLFRAPVVLSAEEQEALVEFARRAPSLTAPRRAELADHLSGLTDAKGSAGVQRVLGMARWSVGEA